jgi:subtilisin family serine protease
VEKLSGVADIAEIREEKVIPTPKFELASNATEATVLANEWGVAKISAPSVWSAGVTGQNVVIGSLDTGVRATHTSIAANFRSSFNWFDATPANKKAAYDDLGHGTHTIGTMVGSNGLGVAPGAKFISCKAFTEDGGEESWLLNCAQFLTCPTDASGNQDCSQAPNVVSNSWGGGQGDKFFAAAIQAWRAANIIPVFANGNSGPTCKTANSPADDPNVIAVGSTDSSDKLSSFSSKGPSVTGLVKPEVSAPGSSVRSAWSTGDTAFNTISGTSMATPHVSGVVALLLSKKPTLTYDQIKSALTTTTDTSTLKASGSTCGGTTDKQFPNNQYGFGRVNAFNAYKSIA